MDKDACIIILSEKKNLNPKSAKKKIKQNGPQLEGHKGTAFSLFTLKPKPFYTSFLQE